MYQPPDTIAVRRSDLASISSQDNTSSRSRSPSPSTVAQRQFQLASLFSGSIVTPDPRPKPTLEAQEPHIADATTLSELPDANGEDEDEAEAETHAFRLFSSTNKASAPLIRLASPSLGPGAILQKRALSYYFTSSSASAFSSQHFRLAAISGEDIQRISRRPWPGTALPWRVKTLYMPRKAIRRLDAAQPVGTGRCDSLAPREPDMDVSPTKNRKKPGKKRRLVLRLRARTKQAAEEERLKNDEEKEAAERLKRAARNREKKAKKVAREKARKASATIAEDGTK